MGRKAQEVTHFAKQVMDECVRLQKQSGMTIKEFAKACGFGEVYWYTRANYSLPLNLSDLERISEVTGVSIGDIVMDSKRHAVEAAERKAQAGGYGLAAYDAAGKQEAINGEAGPDYDEPPGAPAAPAYRPAHDIRRHAPRDCRTAGHRIQRHSPRWPLGLLRRRDRGDTDRPQAHIHGQTVHSRARALALAAWRHRLCEQ